MSGRNTESGFIYLKLLAMQRTYPGINVRVLDERLAYQ